MGGSREVLEETYETDLEALEGNPFASDLEVLEETCGLLLHKEYRRWIEMPT